MINFLALILLILIFLSVLLNFLTLPGNWLMAFLVVLWAFLIPNDNLDFWFFVVFFALLIFGEVVEFLLQLSQSKKAGAGTLSNVLGIIGAIIGAIIFVPFLFGIGAIFGALLGAWLGTFAGEYLLSKKERSMAINAANAAMLGKFLGMIVKFGLGFFLVFHTASHIFEAEQIVTRL